MGNFEKFLFDTSFDKEQSEKAKAAAAAKAAAEAPPPPSFSEAELEAARQAAFAEGKAAGLAEAEGSHARRLAVAVEGLPPLLVQLDQDVAAEADERRRDSLGAAVTVVRKLFPQLARAHGLDELTAVIEQCLERLRDEPRVVIRCADEDLDALREHIERSVTQVGFEGKLVFLADERLASGELRVEWADGGAERDPAALWKEIDTIIARALTPAGGTPTAKAAAQPAAASDGAAQQANAQKPAAAPKPVQQGAASPSPQPDAPAAVQPLRRAQSA